MREFSKISCAVWQSQRFRRLNDKGRLLYLYLHTCPHVNSIGCYYLPMGYISTDLGWNDSAVHTALADLSTGLIQWNSEENIIKINGFLDHSPLTNKSHAIGAVKKALSLPDCKEKTSIIKELKLSQYCKGLKEIEVYLQTCDSPVDTPTPTETETVIKDTTNVVSKSPPKKKRKIEDEFKTDCSLPEQYRIYAEEKGLLNPDDEWEDFFDFWKSEGVGKLDWLATWRGRVRKAVKRQSSGSSYRGGQKQSAGDVTIDAARLAIGGYGIE